MVRDGILRLLVKKSPAGPNRFLNGHIATQGKFSFTRGVAAARIRFERGKGQHGAFWMQPTVARKVSPCLRLLGRPRLRDARPAGPFAENARRRR